MVKFKFDIGKLSRFLPTVEKPIYKVSINQKLMWTSLVLLVYFLLSSQMFGRIYGIQESAGYTQFQVIQLLLGSKFGTLMTLGIGPIVTASILLQLLVGSKIIDWDMNNPDEKRKYQTTQKLLGILFCLFQAVAYVLAGAVPPASNDIFTISFVVAQLTLGGLLVMMMDEIVSKWGIGSGISLFIASGVCERIFIGAFNPFGMNCLPPDFGSCIPSMENIPRGYLWGAVVSLLKGDMINTLAFGLPIAATVVVFVMVIFFQSVSVDIPLAFSAVRGFGRRWSLNLFYTSNIPVILMAALLANFQLWGGMMTSAQPDNPNLKCGLLGCITVSDRGNVPTSGLLYYLAAPRNLLLNILTFVASSKEMLRAVIYTVIMIIGATIFSIFWVTTSGMDPETIADQISSIGMQIPGYRRDSRIIRKVLERYIPALAVLGGATVGFLAAFADFTGALGSGTGILLTVTIIYNFYEQLRNEDLTQAHPSVRKVMGLI